METIAYIELNSLDDLLRLREEVQAPLVFGDVLYEHHAKTTLEIYDSYRE